MRMVKEPYVTYGTAPSSVATRRVCKEAPGRCDGLTLMQVAALDWSHFHVLFQAGKRPCAVLRGLVRWPPAAHCLSQACSSGLRQEMSVHIPEHTQADWLLPVDTNTK